MPHRLKLSQNEIHHLLRELTTVAFKEKGYDSSKMARFHENVTTIGVEEIYRPIILRAFLEERRQELRERDISFLYKSKDQESLERESHEEHLPQPLQKKTGDDLVVVPDDLRKYIISNLILISQDSLETLLPGREEFFRQTEEEEDEDEEKEEEEEYREDEGRGKEDDVGGGGGAGEPGGAEELDESEESHEPDEDGGPAGKGVDHWRDIGRSLAKEVSKKCLRSPPQGFLVKKIGKGWVFSRSREETGEGSLDELFISLSLPVISSRWENLHHEQGELRRKLDERKAENKRLLEKIEDLKKQLRAEKKAKLESSRTVRTLTKSNKKMKRRLKTTKDESDYEHMYG